MEKIVVIHQPDFLSYLGFFHRLLYADLYVILDNVQAETGTSKSWQKRDKIKTPYGEKWFGCCVKKSHSNAKINELFLSDSVDWRKNNINLIRENYKKADYFNEVFPYIQELYDFRCEKMMDFNIKSIRILMELFDIKTNTILASDLNPIGKSNELLVDILKKVDAGTYLSGIGARDYFDPTPFEKAKIEVLWQEFKHPVYKQLYGEFMPYLSSIDLLFNCGIEQSRKILRGE